MDEGNGYTPAEIRRWLARIDARFDRHEDEHISKAEFQSLLRDIEEMKENQRWWRRLLATQALVTLGALIVLAVSLIAIARP